MVGVVRPVVTKSKPSTKEEWKKITMKRVLLYSESLVNDSRWAKQFAAHASSTRQKIDTGSAPDWSAMITKVESAAKAAGADGVIFFLGGHSVPSDENN